MAKSESGESKIPQIIMVVFTSLVAPLVIFFVTNAVKNNPQPAATAVLPAEMSAAQAVDSLAAATATPAPETQKTEPAPTIPGSATPTTPAAATGAPSSTPTATLTAAPPAGSTNPTGLVAAGTPVTVDNFTLTLSEKDILFEGGAIRLVFHVKNLSDQPGEFSFIPGAVTVKDSKKTYAIYYGEKKTACQKADLGKQKTVTIGANSEVTITSTTAKEPTAWCADGKETTLPYFIGPVSRGTSKLEVAIKGLGPFTGFSFEVPVKR